MTPHQILKAARQAIQDLDPLRADALLHEFEAAQPAEPENRQAIAQELAMIRDLAAAALEGVGAAHAELRQLLSRAQTLDTYDKSGNRLMRDMTIQMARKF